MSDPSARESPERASAARLERIEAWIADTVRRQAPLEFRDLRKGVQALSQRYVERRRDPGAIDDALRGKARRGAFAAYYAPLHLLTALAAASVARVPAETKRIVDLGAGSAAAGAGIALALPSPPVILALDRSRWALGEARHTGRVLGLRIQTRTTDLTRRLPTLGDGDTVVAGWFLNELSDAARDDALDALARAQRQGAHLVILEPLARDIAPWWEAAARALGLAAHEVRDRSPLPPWLRDMDRASGLDHGERRARCLSSES